MRKRLRSCVLIAGAALAISTATARTQDAAPPIDMEDLLAMEAAADLTAAAFECSVLALTWASDAPVVEAERLFRLGYDSALTAIAWIRRALAQDDPLGPAAPIFAFVGDEFLIGLYFAEATVNIETELDAEVRDDVGVDLQLATRRYLAAIEYDRRNCGLIGR